MAASCSDRGSGTGGRARTGGIGQALRVERQHRVQAVIAGQRGQHGRHLRRGVEQAAHQPAAVADAQRVDQLPACGGGIAAAPAGLRNQHAQGGHAGPASAGLGQRRQRLQARQRAVEIVVVQAHADAGQVGVDPHFPGGAAHRAGMPGRQRFQPQQGVVGGVDMAVFQQPARAQ